MILSRMKFLGIRLDLVCAVATLFACILHPLAMRPAVASPEPTGYCVPVEYPINSGRCSGGDPMCRDMEVGTLRLCGADQEWNTEIICVCCDSVGTPQLCGQPTQTSTKTPPYYDSEGCLVITLEIGDCD